jgi:hypothetical protein
MRRPSLPALIAASALAIGVSACGDDESSTTTVTETAQTTSSSTESTVTESTGATTTTSENEDGESNVDQVVTELTGFTSPSGNIGCVIDPVSVRCDIQNRDWDPPKAPSSCELDFGQGISLEAGAAPEFVCAGDTTLQSGPELPYGQTIGAGLLRCESEESGITCRDIETGRGFTLSKQRYELF